MDWKSFLVGMANALAWPIVILTLILLLRRQLGGLAERIEEFTFPGGKAVFRKSLEGARQAEADIPVEKKRLQHDERDPELLEQLVRSPEGVVLKSFERIAQRLAEIRSEFELTPRHNLPSVMRELLNRDLIDEATFSLFDNLRSARNAVAHPDAGAQRIAAKEALEFVGHAERLLDVLDDVMPPQPDRKEP